MSNTRRGLLIIVSGIIASGVLMSGVFGGDPVETPRSQKSFLKFGSHYLNPDRIDYVAVEQGRLVITFNGSPAAPLTLTGADVESMKMWLDGSAVGVPVRPLPGDPNSLRPRSQGDRPDGR